MKTRAVLSCRIAVLFAAALVAACGTAPPASMADDDREPAERTASGPVAPGAAAFEQRLRERAYAQVRQGRLAEAATSWEILVALRPGAAEYRERLHETRRTIDALVPDRLQRAQQAQRRGELEAATAQYLSVLTLQPDHAQAAEALRAIERGRNRSLYLGKLSRNTLARSNGSALRAAKSGNGVDRNDVEHAAMLRTQGEIDAAIVLLERYVAARGADAAACRLLADMVLQKSGAAGRLKQQPGTPPRAC
jgi:hypothetical protein